MVEFTWHNGILLAEYLHIVRMFIHDCCITKKKDLSCCFSMEEGSRYPKIFFSFCFVYFGALPTRGGLVPAVRDQRAPGVVKWSSLLLSDYEIPPGRERQTCSLLYYPPYFPDAFLRPSKCFSLSCSFIWSTCKIMPVSCLIISRQNRALFDPVCQFPYADYLFIPQLTFNSLCRMLLRL